MKLIGSAKAFIISCLKIIYLLLYLSPRAIQLEYLDKMHDSWPIENYAELYISIESDYI